MFSIIVVGVFVEGVQGYTLYLEEIDPFSARINGVTILQHGDFNPPDPPRIIQAEWGLMSFDEKGETLNFDLRDGTITEVRGDQTRIQQFGKLLVGRGGGVFIGGETEVVFVGSQDAVSLQGVNEKKDGRGVIDFVVMSVFCFADEFVDDSGNVIVFDDAMVVGEFCGEVLELAGRCGACEAAVQYDEAG